jgi:transposase
MSKKKLQKYTMELRKEAVKLILDESRNLTGVSDLLGIPQGTLYSWVAKERSDRLSQPGLASNWQSGLEAENKRLKQALARAELERDILKKATAFFAKDILRGTHS